ncbi:NAD-dependent epimerase/dehydratase family protein [Rhodospirillaceae bacterium SYSU D60014]|uniref:NAD-dependent epimerase/dehydratase family protein n=1 Tax=Virgifigura deserti TaxID=2268457 RepID=UPI000E671B55
MARYLVTGGCGFIGSHLADALVAGGHDVRILDDLSTGRRSNAPEAAELRIGDVADPAAVAEAMAGVDGCFHLAAVASVARCNTDWAGAHRVNLTGAINILSAARATDGQARVPVVYASSAAVYGDNPELPLGEDARTLPLSAYGADKLGCELHARAAAIVHDLPTIGFRFFNVYGPRQDPKSPYSGVISIFAGRVGRGDPLQIFGDGEQTRDFVYVDDVVRCVLAGMRRLQDARDETPRAEVMNVCTGAATAVRQLAEVMIDLAGQRVPIEHQPPREGDIKVSVGDPRTAGQRLNFKATVPLREGLSRTLASLAHGSPPIATVG